MEKRVGIYTKIFRDEDTIERAIESILNQTYRNIRYYVLVNDATRERVERYARLDKRIVIIDDALGKEALFRLYFKRMARDGNDYIAQLDADDWYDTDWLETMVSFADEHSLDMAACGSRIVDANGQVVAYRRANSICMDGTEVPSNFSNLYSFFRTVWGKIYSKSVILAYDPDKLPDSKEYGGYGGDTLFVLEVLKNVKRFGISEKVLHNYQMSSTSTSRTFVKGRIHSAGILFQKAQDYLKCYGEPSDENMLSLYGVYSNTILEAMQAAKQCLVEKEQAKVFYEFFNSELTKKILLLARELELLGSKSFFGSRIGNQMTKLALGYLQYMDGDEQENCRSFLAYLQLDELTKYILQDTGFLLQYTELALMIVDGETENAMRMCEELLEKDKDALWEEKLIEILLNLAALLGNIEYFILGKCKKLEYMIKTKQEKQAELEYIDLIEMGVQEEGLEQYKIKFNELRERSRD